MPGTRLEIEIKLRAPGAATVRQLLRRLGAKLVGRVHEMNVLYDNTEGTLGRDGRVLRIRRVRRLGPAAKDNAESLHSRASSRGVLTYKGPAQGGSYKAREELELLLESPDRADFILRELGFRQRFRYEKYRTSYRLPRLPRLSVELDETPIGTFIELEGSPRAIDQGARRLGYDPKDYLTASYYDLFRLAHGGSSLPWDEMVFSARK